MSLTSEPIGPSLTRILRIIARIFAVAAVVFGVLLLPGIISQAPYLVGWWDDCALFLLFGLPIVMGTAAAWISGRSIRRLAGAIALGQLLVMLTWLPAMVTTPLPAEANSAWVLGATAIGSTAAGLAWRPRFVWIYLAATCVLVVVVRNLASPQPIAIPLQDALYTLMFDSIFAALAVVAVRAGFRLDAAATSARSNATNEAVDRAHAQELSRVDALMHDGVLATLLIAAQDDPILRSSAARQAARTIDLIEQFDQIPPPSSTIPALEFVWRLQATSTELDPEADFSYLIANGAEGLSLEVSVAFSESLSEAIRNVLRHASVEGSDLHRAVHVTVDAERVEVDVLDDGRGFEPASVGPSRLGIAVSIRGRMAQLAGGSSHVVSKLGHGTRVVLIWERP